MKVKCCGNKEVIIPLTSLVRDYGTIGDLSVISSVLRDFENVTRNTDVYSKFVEWNDKAIDYEQRGEKEIAKSIVTALLAYVEACTGKRLFKAREYLEHDMPNAALQIIHIELLKSCFKNEIPLSVISTVGGSPKIFQDKVLNDFVKMVADLATKVKGGFLLDRATKVLIVRGPNEGTLKVAYEHAIDIKGTDEGVEVTVRDHFPVRIQFIKDMLARAGIHVEEKGAGIISFKVPNDTLYLRAAASVIASTPSLDTIPGVLFIKLAREEMKNIEDIAYRLVELRNKVFSKVGGFA